ncbi:MAG: YkvA family protein [Deltaproteobacteria bacterium]|nr:YkvA family protein [Deltaproteobacteria bacterium]
MTDVDAKCLEVFPSWLRTLGTDGEGMLSLISNRTVPEKAQRTLIGGLNYLFKSLDLIPDGIDDIGYLDDAFVLRVSASLAKAEGLGDADEASMATVVRLADEVQLVKDFLGEDYPRLETYVVGLRRGAARGRSVDDIVGTPMVLDEFASDVRGFAKSYTAPSFSQERKNLIKMRAFFNAKLPR